MYQVEDQHLHAELLLYRLIVMKLNMYFTLNNQNEIHFIYVRAFRIFYCKRL